MMGMYTSAYDNKNVEWQFKTGDDGCQSYVIGEPPSHEWYKAIPDGVYSAIGNRGWASVVMKGNMCIAIIPYLEADDDTWDVPDEVLDSIAKQYGLPAVVLPNKKKNYLKGECEDTMASCQSHVKALMQSTSESAAAPTPTPTN